MTFRPILILVCLFGPPMAGAETWVTYQALTGKTVLMASLPPVVSASVLSDLPPDKTNAIQRIERALSEQGYEIVPDGPHFVRIFPKSTPEVSINAPLRGAQLAVLQGEETVPVGLLALSNADAEQVIFLYAMMVKRTVLRPLSLSGSSVTLRSESPLNQQEAAYALATVLALNGVCIVEDGTNLAQAVPSVQGSQVQTRAPQREPGAKLFDPRKVPSIGVTVTTTPTTEFERLAREFEVLQKHFHEFMRLPDPEQRKAQRLIDLYANLAGKSSVESQDLGGRSVWFHVETPLTKSELLYAIETTFALNHLAIIPVDDGKVRLGRIAEIPGGR